MADPSPTPSPGQRRRLRRRLAYGLGIGAGATLLLAGLRGTRPFQVAEWKTYDERVQLLADPKDASSDIVVIDIDSNSLEAMRDELGRWPWPREAQAMLLGYARSGGARAVVFDVLFPEPDLRDPASDSAFAERLASDGGAVLAVTLAPGRAGEDATLLERHRSAEDPELGRALAMLPRFAVPVQGGTGTAPLGVDLPYAEPPVASFLEHTAAVGTINWTPDPDGVVRWERPLSQRRGEVYPSLALAAARVIEPERFDGPVTFEPGALRIGAERVPVAADGRMLLRWHGPYRSGEVTTYTVIPAFEVLNSFDQVMRGSDPDVPLATFEDKVVLVGATGTGVVDVDARPTPIAPTDPGLMLHATALDNLLQGDAARRAPAAADFAVLAAAGLGAGVVTASFAAATPAIVAFVLLMAAIGVLTTAALASGVWLQLIAPWSAATLAFVGAMVANYVTEGRERRRVRDLFNRYVEPEYARRIADDFESVQLGGERTEITILFNDIRGFTALSERLPAPQVIGLLNDYLGCMCEVVFRHGGTLDKFIGDAVMAFWGAPLATPDHAARALDAALEMAKEMEALNARWAAQDLPAQLAIGVGINTGEAIVGNVGSLNRMLDYTAIGDAVNLASRLEGLNKEFGTTILASESTVHHAGEGYRFRAISSVTVKGRARPVKVFELEGRTESPPDHRPTPAGTIATLLLLGAALAGAAALPVAAQTAAAPASAQASGRTRWTDWVYRPGRWAGGRLVPASTTNQATDSLALVARVEAYALPPRWRLEIARTTDGTTFAEPLVIIGGQGDPVVLTALGSAKLTEHEAWKDPAVRELVDGFASNGRVRQPAPARLVRMAAGGVVDLVVVRRPVARADFPDNLLSAGAGGRLGRALGRLGVQAIGGERRTDVVASAGARGVARVQTAAGEMVINPDTAAVRRLDGLAIDLSELERFIRGLGR